MGRLDAEMIDMVEAASAHVDGDELLRLTAAMVDIPSPTGEERALAEFLAARFDDLGLDGRCQAIDDNQANAIGRLAGAGGGPALMLYAPIDTAFAGEPDEDDPWIDLAVRTDQIAAGRIEGKFVRGLGAHNPKGHGACAVMAAAALHRAGVPLRGDLIVALAAGGMPTNRRPNSVRDNIGHGAGAAFLLQQGVRPDFAIVAKPGPVAWEEVGVSWFRVRVNGVLGYAGTRHVVEHKNPIVDAMAVVRELEAWFPEYTARNTSGLCAPQGSIGYIRGGWPNKPTFIPGACEIGLDLRLNPRTPAEEAKRQFGEAIDRIRANHPSLDLAWDMTLAVPGSHTDEDNWIIRSAIGAFEAVTGKDFAPGANSSGATEANVLRQWGVPTARVGMPAPPEPGKWAGMFSMGEAHVDSLTQLTRILIHAAVDTCARTRDDVGLVAE